MRQSIKNRDSAAKWLGTAAALTVSLTGGGAAFAQETESSSEPITTATAVAAPPAAAAPIDYIVPDLSPARGAPRAWPSAGFTLRPSAAILGGEHFLVVLDEITYPLIYGWMPLDDVLQTLRQRPSHVHVVLTGRRCPPEIIELADTVTEMTKIKHAFNAGVPAQRGIED